MKSNNKLGFNVFDKPLSDINFSEKLIVNTINPHSYCISLKDSLFKKSLLRSDILLPDGIGIVFAEKILNNNKIIKIAGYDIFIFLMNKINKEKGKVFFLGSTNKVLKAIKRKSKNDFPNVKIGYFSPPFKKKFTNKDSVIMCKEVNKFRPDILFVGMTAPKQEKWVFENRLNIKSNVICSIGAVFDFYSGNIKRAPKFMINLGLEWLHRSFTSFRLFKRSIISNPKFIYYIFMIKFFKTYK